jgi:hypothetical protein
MGPADEGTQFPDAAVYFSNCDNVVLFVLVVKPFWIYSQERRIYFCYSLASSTGDLSLEAAQLERAIRNNDTLRVKRFLDLHHDKFQVSLYLVGGM